ncbi:ribonuclease H-like domain-containing protein [Gloeopeniophorella convolvens]|nr:ribonuclease H-like domain-containing protein [Gloeopeniophorella convolvens]
MSIRAASGGALKATKHAAGLPADLAFHRSVDSDLAKDLEASSSKVLSLTNMLLDLASTIGGSRARLRDEDDFIDRFGALIVEPMDQLLERADIALDQFSGRTKAPAIAINPPEPKKKPAPSGRQEPVIQHAAHLPKPQLKFKRKVDNANGLVWQPSLRHKFNAQVPLGYTFQPESTVDDPERTLSPHPYRYEIQHLSYPTRMFQSQPPVPFRPFEETPFTWVTTREQLTEMINKLRRAQEIAIDLEYHSYRTFGGFVCLMQISTREEDWVVDVFELREELEDLNEVFTNPNIVKVLHGAESDVVWLQQDFNLYLVNMFDTFHASKVLDFPRHGLATLLEMYCDFSPDKRYQLADWRVRPLSDEMLKYARADTHFLLYVYDNLRNALLDRAISRAASPTSRAGSPTAPDMFVREVLSRSAETALRTYTPEIYDEESGAGPGGWDTLARRWNKPMLGADAPRSVAREVFRAAHAWRDRVAREEDESTGYVLANRLVFKLAEQPPADMAALLHAFPSTPPVVRRRAKELLDAIREAAAKPTTPAAAAEPELVKMEVDALQNPTDSCAVESWSRDQELPTASTSALFGSTPAPFRLRAQACGSSSTGTAKTRFEDVVNRIHSALVIAPTVPKALAAAPTITATATTTTATTTNVTDDVKATPLVGATAEVPFVPAHQRQAAKQEVVEDALVVVGQRQKKRKRQKKADGASEKAEPVEDIVPFDFASAPNILDDGGERVEEDSRAGKKKRQKRTGGGAVDRGGFAPAPKDRREVKSGNVTHSFRS